MHSVVVISAIRLSLFFKTRGLIPPNRASARLVTFSTIESAIAVMSSCLPLLKPLFVKAATKVRSIGSQSSGVRSTQALTGAHASQEKDTQRSLTASHVTSTYSAEIEAPAKLQQGQLD